MRGGAQERPRSSGVGIFSVKRYVAAAREDKSLAPKKRPGSKPNEGARRLLEAMGRALDAVMASDAPGFLDDRGYRATAQLSWPESRCFKAALNVIVAAK